MGALAGLARLYRPAPHAPPLAGEEAQRRAWRHWRIRMFLGMFLGYGLFYFGRKNISAALSPLGDDLGYSNTQLGLIGATLYVTYGLGKFLNGLLADRAHVRTFLCTGLLLTGVMNLVFGSLTALWALCLAWGLNGWAQSMGFPPIARGMTVWFPPEGKATRWAFWTCSHQAGTAAVMAFTAWILGWGDWRWCFYLPGILCVISAVAMWFTLGDTPQSQGLPPIDAFPEERGAVEETDYRTAFVRRVLLNRNVWVIGGADLFAYAVRFGTLDWTAKYLHEVKGYAQDDAAFRAGIMPLFGVLGVLVSGWICDRFFRGRFRVTVAVAFGALALMVYAFESVGPGHALADLALMAAIGFFVETPQSILGGVAAVDAGCSARVASASAGLVGILAYTGAVASSLGTGKLIDAFGWTTALHAWVACALAGFLLCLTLWRERPAAQ